MRTLNILLTYGIAYHNTHALARCAVYVCVRTCLLAFQPCARMCMWACMRVSVHVQMCMCTLPAVHFMNESLLHSCTYTQIASNLHVAHCISCMDLRDSHEHIRIQSVCLSLHFVNRSPLFSCTHTHTHTIYISLIEFHAWITPTLMHRYTHRIQSSLYRHTPPWGDKRACLSCIHACMHSYTCTYTHMIQMERWISLRTCIHMHTCIWTLTIVGRDWEITVLARVYMHMDTHGSDECACALYTYIHTYHMDIDGAMNVPAHYIHTYIHTYHMDTDGAMNVPAHIHTYIHTQMERWMCMWT